MAQRLTILLVLLAFLGGNVLAGMPFGSRQGGTEAMPCCKKNRKMKHRESARADAVRLCCTLNCASPSPTAPQSAAQSNVSTVWSAVAFYSAILDLLPSLQKSRRRQQQQVSFALPSQIPRKIQPTYIRHHSFLI